MPGQPKPTFYAAIAFVIVGLVAFAAWRYSDILAPKGKVDEADYIDPSKIGIVPTKGDAEAPDTSNVTTVKEYTFVPADRLPAVKGTAGYKEMQNNTVRFAINVWAGWAPIIWANNGNRPEKVWKTPDGQEFRVELVLADNPVAMRDSYAAGEFHIGWGTLDMLPLFVDGFVDSSGQPTDSRIMPRVFQQIDWSNGGDGIVARQHIKTVADLRGQTIALAANSPSHYFLLNMLVRGGVQPSEVSLQTTADAFQAAAAFNREKDIAACVSWAPDIYKLSDVQGNRMLVNTATANKLIADVWYARADFAKDHPGIIEGLVRGIFDAMIELKKPENKEKCATIMAGVYGIKPEDAAGMFADAHSTNWAENYQFFLNQNNPTNFANVWNQAYYLYRQVRVIQNPPVAFDQVMDYSVIKKLGEEEKYRAQRDESLVAFAPKTSSEVRAEDEILTNTVRIHFFPNDWDPYKKIFREDESGNKVEAPYDPRAPFIVEEIGKLAGQFSNARIIIEGHADGSNRHLNRAEVEQEIRTLSLNRANAVKESVVKKYNLDPHKFNVEGHGWDRPSDPTDPNNHAKNRRVEVKVYTAEKQ